jgi:hypothetical protein
MMWGRKKKRTRHTFVHFNVDGTPPYVVLAGVFIDDTLVLWTSASLFARKVDECARGGDNCAFVADGVFVEEGDGGVALYLDAVHVEAGLGEVVEVAADDWDMVREVGRREEGDIRLPNCSESCAWA